MVEHKHNVPLKARITKYTTSTVRVMTAAIVAIGVMMSGAMAQAAPVGLLQDSFMDATTTLNAWSYSGNQNYTPCLTAGSGAAGSLPKCPDIAEAPGSGSLRLTQASNEQVGYVIYNNAFTTSGGVDITFDSYQYGGSGADGISFFLIDGAKNPTQRGIAGSGLGYVGIEGGYVGIGLDRYGNFSNGAQTSQDPTTGGSMATLAPSGPGPRSNNIVLRGSQQSKYQYVSGVAAQRSLSGTTRTNSKTRVHITINKDNIMNVEVSYDGGVSYVPTIMDINLSTVAGQGGMPSTFKLGFAASTGGATDVHEIQNLAVKSLITPIVAEDDTLTAGTSANLGNVFGNDLLGSSQPSASAATTTLLDDGGTGATLAADGTLTASKTLEPGTYTLVYEICETASPANCSTATITLTVPTQLVVKPIAPAPSTPSAPSTPNTGSALPLPLIVTSSIALLLMLIAGMKARTYLPNQR
jgi:hypothetical protein